MITVHSSNKDGRGVSRAQDNAGDSGMAQRAARQDGDGFSVLHRVEDWVIDPGTNLDQQAYHAVELLTYVVDGCLDYRDQDGRAEQLLGGEVQCVRIGHSLAHTEANASHSEPLHIIRASLRSETEESASSYQRRYFPDDGKLDKLCLLAAHGDDNGALALAADAKVYAAVIRAGEPLLYYRPRGRRAWLQIARGAVMLNEILLESGDAAAVEGDDDGALRLLAQAESELLLFELP